MGVKRRLFLSIPPFNGDNHPAIQEEIAYLHRLIEEPSRIVPQVQDEAVEPFGIFPLEGFQGLSGVGGGRFLELHYLEESISLFEGLGFDALDIDNIPHDGDILHLSESLAYDGDGDLGSLGPPQSLDALHEAQSFGRFLIDLEDLVPSLDPCPVGRGVLNRGDDRQDPILYGYLHSHSAEAPLGLHLEFPIHFRVVVGGVGIKTGEHPLDRSVYKVLCLDILHVVRFHDLQDVGEDLELFVGLVCEGRDVVDIEATHEEAEDEPEEYQKPCLFVCEHSFLPTIFIFAASPPYGAGPATLRGSQPCRGTGSQNKAWDPL